MVKYRDLYFGLSDSRNEYNKRPDDFVRSYVDVDNIVADVIRGEKTFIFGPKGTGKTALGYYVVSQQMSNGHVALVRDASSLPLAEIPNLDTGQPVGVDRTVTAWIFILLCNYLDLVLKDQQATVPNVREVRRVTKLLKNFGFMGDASGRALLKTSQTTIQIPVPKVGTVYKRESKPNLNIYSLLPYLEEWAAGAESPNRHILFIDGLDSIYLNDAKYDESLAALVQASYALNQKLSASTGSVVLLLRNDVFSRISMRVPDSQKMRDDLGSDLDWRVMTGSAGINAPLIRLVDSKVTSELGLETKVLDFFPRHVSVGQNRKIPALQYLLNLTRHTPRDLLRLFEEIRAVDAAGIFPDSQILSRDTIREGVIRYSSKYFVNAIRNEFAGYEGGEAEVDACLSALRTMPRQKFDREQFETSIVAIDASIKPRVDRLLKLLFFSGAIGNLVGNDSYLRFHHRRDDAEIYLRGTLILHDALCHAWNIPFSI